MEDFKQRDGNPTHQKFRAANLVVEKKNAANGIGTIMHPSLSKEGWSVFQSFMENDQIDENGVNPIISTFKNYVGGTTISFTSPSLALYEPQGSSAGEKLYVDPSLKNKIANDGSITDVLLDCVSVYNKLIATNGALEILFAMDSNNTTDVNAEISFDSQTILPMGSDTSANVLFKSQDVSAEGTDSFVINQGQKLAITGLPSYSSFGEGTTTGTYTFYVKEIKA